MIQVRRGKMVTYENLNKLTMENLMLFRSLFEENSDSIFVLNKAGYIIDGNAALMHLSGYLLSELQGIHFLSLIDEPERQQAQEKLFGDAPIYKDYRFTFVLHSEEKIECLMKLVPMKHNEKIEGYFLILKDMRELDKLAEQFLKSEFNFRSITENVQDVIMLMDANQKYLYVSPSSIDMFGFNYKDIYSKEAFFNIHEDYVDEITEKFELAMKDGKPYTIRLKVFHTERGWIWTEIKGKPIFNENQSFHHMLLVARDISKEKKQEEQLKYFAYHDALSNLPNRRMFRDYLSDALTELQEANRPFAVMLLDIDDFKRINDSYGHEIGDRVIVEFGRRIQECVGEHGMAARLGGDEFSILIKDAHSQTMVEPFARNIIKSFEEPITVQQTILYITTSIGIILCHNDNITAAKVLRSSDEALYTAKGYGKNNYAFKICK